MFVFFHFLFISEWRTIKVFVTYKVHSSLKFAPFSLSNWRFYCRRVTALWTILDFTVYAISIHPYPSHCLVLGSFQEAWCWNGFHVSFSQKWLLSRTVGWSSPGTETVAWCKPCVLGRALCVGGSGEPRRLELSSSGLSSWVFCCLNGPDLVMTWCLFLQSGTRFPNKPETEGATSVSAESAPKSFGWTLESKDSNTCGGGYF